jgi:hypothetical protein
MFDKILWLSRWALGAIVGGVAGIWLIAVAFALAGFRQTAESINDIFLNVLPIAATLFTVLFAVALICWFLGPSRKGS